MKLFISALILALFAGTTGLVAAQSTSEEICTTDSYGNTNCTTSTTTTTETVTYVEEPTTTTSVEILDTSVPGAIKTAAVVAVGLGAISLILRRTVVK